MSLTVVPKTAHTRRENRATQPITAHAVFANPDVVAEGWYSLCAGGELKRGQVRSFKITHQRVAVFRGEDGRVRAMDAFCPHMGADLGNGTVEGNRLRCYFHHWTFEGDGTLSEVPKGRCPRDVALRRWPVEEKYGHVWVYAGAEPAHAVPCPPGLEGEELEAHCLGEVKLFAHHHVMFVGGVDLLHFATVHGIDVDFDLRVKEECDHTALWSLRGTAPARGWRGRLAHGLLGGQVNYDARVAGGSIVTLTYGAEQRLARLGWRVPTLHILWGCQADEEGIGSVKIFLLARRGAGLKGRALARLKLAATALLLGVLRDDDVKAFPNMRFQTGRLGKGDASAARMVQFLNGVPVSPWSRKVSGNASS